MIYLSQRDPQWASQKLGSSNLTIGRYGCTTTCISMLSDYFKCYRSPLDLARNADYYTPDGLVLWTKMMFVHMTFDGRVHGEAPVLINISLKDPNKAVLLQVNNGQHWVVALRKTLFGNDYVCLDPWTGKKCTAKGTYHNITGSAHFKRI